MADFSRAFIAQRRPVGLCITIDTFPNFPFPRCLIVAKSLREMLADNLFLGFIIASLRLRVLLTGLFSATGVGVCTGVCSLVTLDIDAAVSARCTLKLSLASFALIKLKQLLFWITPPVDSMVLSL